MNLKNILRNFLNFLHVDLTTNLKYDRLTKVIMKNCIKQNSNCIDVGCHKGEILNNILKLAPHGKHFAFEPIPNMYEALKLKYQKRATILPFALAATNGNTTFNFVKNDPAYSGIQQRQYDIKNPDIKLINVEQRTLDSVIPNELPIDFIKIDVEGGEFGVMQGAQAILQKWRPTIIFECGIGASNYYGTTPSEIYNFITGVINLKINTLQGFLDNQEPLTQIVFSNYFETANEYYYVAYP
jgi:FkbM family methyltransferase